MGKFTKRYASMDHRVIIDILPFSILFVSSMNHRVKHGQLYLSLCFLCFNGSWGYHEQLFFRYDFVSSMDHRVIMDKCAFPCAFLSSMDHRVKHGQLLLLESFLCLQWIIELNMDTFAFQYVFESSMYHIIIMLSVAFGYAFCIFNVS